MSGDACSSNCGFCGRCTTGDGDGRIVRRTCSRCRGALWMTRDECENNGLHVICEDCRHYLLDHPAVAELEHQQALQRSEAESIALRARWAQQDAEPRKGAA